MMVRNLVTTIKQSGGSNIHYGIMIIDHLLPSYDRLPEDYGAHLLRRTKPSLIYRRTKNLRAVQLLVGHATLESTVRYRGLEVDDVLKRFESARKSEIELERRLPLTTVVSRPTKDVPQCT